MTDQAAATLRAAYRPHYERLAALKARWDPTNLFHDKRTVPPTGPPGP